MKHCFLVLLAVIASAALFARTSENDVLKQRRKGTDCNSYASMMQTKSNFELQFPSVKVSRGKETTIIKPSDETMRLGLAMKAICEAYTSDASMTTQHYLEEMHKLEDNQRQVEQKIVVQAQATLGIKAEATANIKNKESDNKTKPHQ